MAVVAAAAAAAMSGGPALAASGARRPPSFDGRCDLAGTLVEQPPLTNALVDGRAQATASGQCSGTLIDGHGRRHVLDRQGGSATGVAAVDPSEDPVAIAQACSGTGLSTVRIRIKLSASDLAG